MADFRRIVLALAIVALFVGAASAQNPPLVCTANAAVPPTIRSEGFTEGVGDIVITCTGGPTTQFAGGTQALGIPTANFTVFFGTNVTSRLLPVAGASNASEALLMIDEPGAPNLGTFGSQQAQNLCPTPASGCITEGSQVVNNGNALANNAHNVYQGLVTGNQVTFLGVPVLAPGTTGARVFRITNVRVNAAGLNASGNAPAPVQAFVSISGSTSLPLTNSQVIVGYATSGLTTALRNAGNTGNLGGSGTGFQQCVSTNSLGAGGSFTGILQYTANFATAFKQRTATSGTPGTLLNGPFTGAAAQNTPGAIFSNSESMFIYPTLTGSNGSMAGLADFGTRFKAVFTNVPAGVTLLVSTTNVPSNGVAGGTQANTATSFAVLVASETSPENGNAFPVINSSTSSGTVSLATVTPVNGTATAVWEVVNSNTNTLQQFNFVVQMVFSAATATNNPATGPISVNMSFAPTPSQGAFTASSAGSASSSLPIPRFADTSTPRTIATINLCQTLLLFPYITTVTGFETGLAISNTTVDVSGTAAQSGSCTLSWFGNPSGTPNPASSNTGTIAAGTTFTGQSSATNMAGAGFTGYMFALCNFQFAHGYAAITDVGVRNILSSYLALVVNGGRGPAAESLAH